MTFKLTPFKEYSHSLEVLASAKLDAQFIQLNFTLTGDISDVSLPNNEKALNRKLGLWETTCFEFFLADRDSDSYFEFNFSPSGDWNCFFFNAPGDDLVETKCTLKDFSTHKTVDQFNLSVRVKLNSLEYFVNEKSSFLMNLTAVLEVRKELSYWAFGHPSEMPNFHDFKYFKKIKKSGNKPKLVT